MPLRLPAEVDTKQEQAMSAAIAFMTIQAERIAQKSGELERLFG